MEEKNITDLIGHLTLEQAVEMFKDECERTDTLQNRINELTQDAEFHINHIQDLVEDNSKLNIKLTELKMRGYSQDSKIFNLQEENNKLKARLELKEEIKK